MGVFFASGTETPLPEPGNGTDVMGSRAPEAAPAPRAISGWKLYALIVAAFAVPLVVALGVLAHPTWYPTLDLAHTEMRVRDVWSLHPPLVGLPGRVRAPGETRRRR